MRRILLLTILLALLAVGSSVQAGDRYFGSRSSGYYFRPERSTFFYRPDYLFNRGCAFPRAYFAGGYGYGGYYGRGFSPYYPPGGGFVGGPRRVYATYLQTPTASEFVRTNTSDIVFTVSPSSAQIYVDNKLIGSARDYSSRDRYEVINGIHELRIEHPGYKSYRAEMNVQPNRTVHVEVALARD